MGSELEFLALTRVDRTNAEGKNRTSLMVAELQRIQDGVRFRQGRVRIGCAQGSRKVR